MIPEYDVYMYVLRLTRERNQKRFLDDKRGSLSLSLCSEKRQLYILQQAFQFKKLALLDEC
jgi:hypothetical protein